MRALKIERSITRRDEKSLERYLGDISKYEVLTPEEELDLFHRFKSGDEEAYAKLLLHNLRFVVSVAKQYQHTGLKLGDLINEGNIGLIKAAQRFDPSRGFKFISYAVWWIRQSIIQAINDKGRKIRLPSNFQSTSTKIQNITERYMQKVGREPTPKELAEELEMSEERVRTAISTYKKCRSLDASLMEGEDLSLVQVLEDQNVDRPDHHLEVRESQKKQVQHLLTNLSPREATVISLYYGIERKYPMTLGDIGEYIGISRERTRQIRDKGLRKLRIRHSNMQPAL